MPRCLVYALSLVASMAYAHGAALPIGKAIVLTTAYGTRLNAYVVGPEDASRTVLLLHDRYGFTAQMRDWADRFADLGYRALAIDLYDGRRADSWKQATTIMNSIDQEWSYANMTAALTYLKGENLDRKVVILGWDYGGTEAFLAALRDPTSVETTVSYYPAHLDFTPTSAQTVQNPAMLVLAKRDAELHVRPTEAVISGMGNSGIKFIVQGLDALSNLGEIAAILRANMAINVTGLDADRGFCDPLSEHYDATTCTTAWKITQDFLARNLTH